MSDINRLTCEEVFRRLDDYLDRELTPDEMTRVKDHLDTCEICAREHRFEERMVSGLKQKLRRITAPKDLADKIAKSLERLKEDEA